MKVVGNSSTVIGSRCKDIYAIFGVLSKFYEGSNKRFFNGDQHIRMAATGLLADVHSLADAARREAPQNISSNFS